MLKSLFFIIKKHSSDSLYMNIDTTLLQSPHAVILDYNIADAVFLEDDVIKYYYQIIEGKVKLNNYTENGREILQNILEVGNSIGEYLLFLDDVGSPVNAVALTKCKILKLPKQTFINLLYQSPELLQDFNRKIAKTIHFRHIMGKGATQSSSMKLKSLFDYMKSHYGRSEAFTFQVPLTRQEMANYTGLCVETTIKTLKNMEKNNLVKIVNRKIFY